jgi:hypothetical protein
MAVKGGAKGEYEFLRNKTLHAVNEIQHAYIPQNIPLAGRRSPFWRAMVQFQDFNRQQLAFITTTLGNPFPASGNIDWQALRRHAWFWGLLTMVAGPYAVPFLTDIARFHKPTRDTLDNLTKRRIEIGDKKIAWNMMEGTGVNTGMRVGMTFPGMLPDPYAEGGVEALIGGMPAADFPLSIYEAGKVVKRAEKEAGKVSDPEMKRRRARFILSHEPGMRANLSEESMMGATLATVAPVLNKVADLSEKMGWYGPAAALEVEAPSPGVLRGPGAKQLEALPVGSTISSRILRTAEGAEQGLITGYGGRPQAPLRPGWAGEVQKGLMYSGLSPFVHPNLGEKMEDLTEEDTAALVRGAKEYQNLRVAAIGPEAAAMEATEAGVLLTPEQIMSTEGNQRAASMTRMWKSLDSQGAYRMMFEDELGEAFILDTLKEYNRFMANGNVAEAQRLRTEAMAKSALGYRHLIRLYYLNRFPNEDMEGRRASLQEIAANINADARMWGDVAWGFGLLKDVMTANGWRDAKGQVFFDRDLTIISNLIHRIPPGELPLPYARGLASWIMMQKPEQQFRKRELVVLMLAARNVDPSTLLTLSGTPWGPRQ